MICLSLVGSTISENLRAATRFAPFIDMVELRADFLLMREREDLHRFPSALPPGRSGTRLPVILTIRTERDGGKWTQGEGERRHLLLHGVRGGGYAYVDLEDWLGENDELIRISAAVVGTRVIRSMHDFTGVPDNLFSFLSGVAGRPGEIPKAAVMPSGTADLVRFVKLARELAPGPRVLVAMGSVGFPVRVLARRLGSMLTFCSPNSVDEVTAAPGHIDPQTMHDLYRYHDVSDRTAVFGVIGNPVMHSRSAAYHNPRFSTDGVDAVYLPFEVDDPAAFVELCDLLPIDGFSVTIPHKQKIISFLQHEDESVSGAGACNTVVRGPDGLTGYNTDVVGFLDPLKQTAAGAGWSGLAGRRATVVGAGGAARAVVFALLSEGVEVLLLNRSVQRAHDLVERLDAGGSVSVHVLDSTALPLMANYRDIIVQTTSIGMEPDVSADPLAFYRFEGTEVVYDIVYTPEQTTMLHRAADAGCRTVSGRLMFDRQAEQQYLLYRERAANRERAADRSVSRERSTPGVVEE